MSKHECPKCDCKKIGIEVLENNGKFVFLEGSSWGSVEKDNVELKEITDSEFANEKKIRVWQSPNGYLWIYREVELGD